MQVSSRFVPVVRPLSPEEGRRQFAVVGCGPGRFPEGSALLASQSAQAGARHLLAKGNKTQDPKQSLRLLTVAGTQILATKTFLARPVTPAGWGPRPMDASLRDLAVRNGAHRWSLGGFCCQPYGLGTC